MCYVLWNSKANDWPVCSDYGENRILCIDKTFFAQKNNETKGNLKNILETLLHHMVLFTGILPNFTMSVQEQQIQNILDIQLRS